MTDKINIKELTDPLTPVEHRQKILRGLISQIPGFGSIITEYLPDSRITKLTNFVVELKIALDNLKETIDENYIKRDDVSCIVEKSLRSVSETYDDSKIAALKNGLVKTITNKNIVVDRKDFYINILNSLSPFHFRMLYLLYKTEDYISEHNITLSTSVTSGRIYFFRQALPNMSEDEIKLVVSDLISKGLINSISLTGMQSQNGINAIKGFENSLGNQFMDFFSE